MWRSLHWKCRLLKSAVRLSTSVQNRQTTWEDDDATETMLHAGNEAAAVEGGRLMAGAGR